MTDYETARAKHDKAFKAFDLIRTAYRECKIDDDEFLEAKKLMTQQRKSLTKLLQLRPITKLNKGKTNEKRNNIET